MRSASWAKMRVSMVTNPKNRGPKLVALHLDYEPRLVAFKVEPAVLIPVPVVLGGDVPALDVGLVGLVLEDLLQVYVTFITPEQLIAEDGPVVSHQLSV